MWYQGIPFFAEECCFTLLQVMQSEYFKSRVVNKIKPKEASLVNKIAFKELCIKTFLKIKVGHRCREQPEGFQ